MSKCDLAIEFERVDCIYQASGPVRGTVVVQTNTETRCDALILDAYWETHGRGNIDRGQVAQVVLFRGEWEAGETYRYPFEFTAPSFPPTLRGKSLNVDHYVKVSADVPWAFDPKATQDYLLLSSSLPGDGHGQTTRRRPGSTTDSLGSKNPQQLLIFLVLILIGTRLPLPFGPLLILFSVLLGVRKVRRISAVRRLGSVRVSVQPVDLLAGGSIALDGTIRPSQAIELESATVVLRGTEVTVSGSGTKRSTHRREIAKVSNEICQAAKLPRGKEFQIHHVMQVPGDAAPSFLSENNELLWTLALELKQARQPTWKREWVLRILPQVWEDVLLPADSPGPRSEGEEIEAPFFEEITDDHPELAHQQPSLPDAPESESLEPDATEPEAPKVEAPAFQSQVPEPTPSASSGFAAIYSAVAQLDRFGEERKQRIATEIGQEHEFDLTLERVKWTYGAVGEAFQQGRTLEAKLEPDQQRLLIHLPKDLNQAADALKPGAKLHLRAVLTTWNSTYGLPEFESAAPELPSGVA